MKSVERATLAEEGKRHRADKGPHAHHRVERPVAIRVQAEGMNGEERQQRLEVQAEDADPQ